MLLLLMFAFLGFAATGANAGVSETCGPPIGMFPFHADRVRKKSSRLFIMNASNE